MSRRKEKTKPKLVIDTNVLITTINRNNPEYEIYLSFENKDFNWVVSNEILSEYTETLSQFYSYSTANLVSDILCTATNVIFTEPFFRWGIIQEDPDENKFADLAISSSCDAIVTFDRHFQVFEKLDFPKLKILHPKDFSLFLNSW